MLRGFIDLLIYLFTSLSSLHLCLHCIVFSHTGDFLLTEKTARKPQRKEAGLSLEFSMMTYLVQALDSIMAKTSQI